MEQPRTLKIQSSTLATSSEIERRRVKDRPTSAASVHLVHLERRGACLLLEPLDSIQAPRVATEQSEENRTRRNFNIING